MNLYDVIKKPVITEKSMVALEAGKYTFEVDTRAHKLLIKQAVEAAFEGVKVASVNTVTVSRTLWSIFFRAAMISSDLVPNMIAARAPLFPLASLLLTIV